ncbi:gastric triacylglycerol lipase isoform X1 [Leptinotarsa decemlineata]|uniref:gastric triacylglycerol lipase isoform X1 n=1 Tax=Leptinotarsa decemlineata TaxID=7539 RepID=UPI003D305069
MTEKDSRRSIIREYFRSLDLSSTLRCFFFLYLIYTCANIMGIYILEFTLGPRIGVELPEPKANITRNLVEGYGYPFESHDVISGSGYILTLHRIPHGIKKKHWKTLNRPVALFQHGLVASSDAFLFRGPDFDLPYTLADAGYDVWLSNMRGNVYSRKHKTMDSTKDLQFWDFTLHEIGVQDYPAIFDYILNKTKQQELYFLGHSVGSTAGFILCSAMPEYNKKIKLHLSLAPLVYVNHSITLAQKMLIFPGLSVMETAMSNGIYNCFPRRPFFSRMMQMICEDGMIFQRLCLKAVFTVVGQKNSQFNTSYLPSCFEYFPAGTSMFLMQHTLQLYVKGDFSPFDYGNETHNMQKYNESIPAPYNLSMVTHPVLLYYGSGDILVTEEDIISTLQKLPNSLGKFQVPFENFNHMDFMWGKDAKELLYDKLIVMMDKYR